MLFVVFYSYYAPPPSAAAPPYEFPILLLSAVWGAFSGLSSLGRPDRSHIRCGRDRFGPNPGVKPGAPGGRGSCTVLGLLLRFVISIFAQIFFKILFVLVPLTQPAEATGLGFFCFVFKPRVLSTNRELIFSFTKYPPWHSTLGLTSVRKKTEFLYINPRKLSIFSRTEVKPKFHPVTFLRQEVQEQASAAVAAAFQDYEANNKPFAQTQNTDTANELGERGGRCSTHRYWASLQSKKTGKISIFIEDISRYSIFFGTVGKP